MAKKKKRFSIVKALLCILLAVVLIAGAYVAYALISFHRFGNMALEPKGEGSKKLEIGQEYSIVSWNIGYGAYEDDYDFFLDGGHESWAWSKERLLKNLDAIANSLVSLRGDINLIQEVDIDSTRSYHVDEREPLIERFNKQSYVFSQNYDSPFLMYPFYQPHGISRAGLMTFSDFYISTADRVELPIQEGFRKFIDLDRCYSKSRIKLDNDKDLLVYNLHLSAFDAKGKVVVEQLNILLSDMQAEYEKGNYCIAGGDFNMDLLRNSPERFGYDASEVSWLQALPEGIIEEYGMSLVVPFDYAKPMASCRNPDGPYNPSQKVYTLDGFVISENVELVSNRLINYEFKCSDHNPVQMSFKLK